jgi:protein MpaA
MKSSPETFLFGRTALGLPIIGYRWEGRGPEILLLGGVHGDESEGVACAYGLLDHFLTQGMNLPMNLTLVPAFNLDGVLAKTRVNGNQVDLNRNLPSNDWDPKAFNERYPPGPHANSEPENQALVKFLESRRPRFIFSLHSFRQTMLNTNGDCAPEAEAMHALTGYEITPTMGYPTPGSLGTYAGMERDMPTLTIELLRGMDLREVVKTHVKACLAGLAAAALRK